MYAICNVVCGAEMPKLIRSYLKEILIAKVPLEYEIETLGFETLYSGNGFNSIYSGIILFKFDECSNTKAAELIPKLTANEDQINQARQALANTRKRFQEFLSKDEETSDEKKQKLLDSLPQNPEVLLIWSTS